MKKSIFYLSGLAVVMMAASCANNSTDSKQQAENANDVKIDSAKSNDTTGAGHAMVAMKPDADFAVEAADGGLMEVQLGKLAQQKGVSKQIKDLGALMVKDHGMAYDELTSAAIVKNITIPSTLSDKCQQKVNELTEKKGAEFDKAYAALMVDDHKEDLNAFKKEATKGNDSLLSSWAKGKVPILEHHLMMAEQAKKAVKGN